MPKDDKMVERVVDGKFLLETSNGGATMKSSVLRSDPKGCPLGALAVKTSASRPFQTLENWQYRSGLNDLY